MRVASLALGITQYTHAAYAASGDRLKYCESDARAFTAYAKNAWPDSSQAQHLCLNGEVTYPVLKSAIAALTGSDLDLFVLYCSGHGDVSGAHAWFCLSDAKPTESSLEASAFDEMLGSIDAQRVLFILDCCYAEAVMRDSKFFSRLDGNKLRLCLCSARATQRAWEDDEIGQSVFSHFLLCALSTDSPVQNRSGWVDFEGGVFRYAQEQVTLRAFALKHGATQEVVKFGLSTLPLELPTVASSLVGRPLSTGESIRRRLRRIVGVALLGTVSALVLLDVSIVHLAADPNGGIDVRPGLAPLFQALPYHIAPVVETEFNVAHFNLNVPRELLGRFYRGGIWTIVSHRDSQGLRKWWSNVEPLLRSSVRWRAHVLTTGKLPDNPVLKLDPEYDLPPLEEFRFLAAHGRAATIARDKIYPHVLTPPCAPGDDPRRKMDFTLLNLPSDRFAADLRWEIVTASVETATPPFAFIENCILSVAYRQIHDDQEPAPNIDPIAELSAFCDALRETHLESTPDNLETLGGMTKTWCQFPALGALIKWSDHPSRKAIEASLLGTIRTFDPTTAGDVPPENISLALVLLEHLARIEPLEATTVDSVSAYILRDSRGLSGFPTLVEWLGRVATVQALPTRVMEFLRTEFMDEKLGGDFRSQRAYALLCICARFAKETDLPKKLLEWQIHRGNDQLKMTEVVSGVGWLSTTVPIPAEVVRRLVNEIQPDVYFGAETKTNRGSTLIRHTDLPAGTALGRIAQHQQLTPAQNELLKRFAIARLGFEDRREVIKGLAVIRYDSVANSAREIYQTLTDARSDRARRRVESEIAVAHLCALAPQLRRDAQAELLRIWDEESEPELRIEIARVIGASTR